MTIPRRALMLTVAVFIVLLAASPAMAAPTSEACGPACGSSATISPPGERRQQCLPDAGCGGGALVAAGTGPFIALAAATGVVAIASVARRFPSRSILPTSRLLATRLFHPPQLSLSV